jgi:lipoprotein signal peptidase
MYGNALDRVFASVRRADTPRFPFNTLPALIVNLIAFVCAGTLLATFQSNQQRKAEQRAARLV